MISRSPSFKGSTKSTKTGWKRENLRVQLSSAPSIEECGLDSYLYGEGLHALTPHESTIPAPSSRKEASTASTSTPSELPFNTTLSMPGLANDAPRREKYVDEADVLRCNTRKENILAAGKNYQARMKSVCYELNSRIPAREEGEGYLKRKASTALVARGGQVDNGMTGIRRSGGSIAEDDILLIASGNDEGDDDHASVVTNSSRFKDHSLRLRSSGFKNLSSTPAVHYHHGKGSGDSNCNPSTTTISGGIELDEDGRPLTIATVQEQYTPVSGSEMDEEATFVKEEREEDSSSSVGKPIAEDYSNLKSKGDMSEIGEGEGGSPSSLVASVGAVRGGGGGGRSNSPESNSQRQRSGMEATKEVLSSVSAGKTSTLIQVSPSKSSSKPPLVPLSPKIPRVDSLSSATGPQDDLQSGTSASVKARKRWRRVSNTLNFTRRMQSVRASASDFLEHTGPNTRAIGNHVRIDAGRAGAAAFEGARTSPFDKQAPPMRKGRKGMEGMLVRQDKGLVTLVQDFYVACLKMPIGHFLVGVFLAPIALGLLFTPLYLVDKAGLALDGVTLSDDVVIVGKMAVAKQKVSALLNVFLYALSLSTTFGGSPVNAMSPFCLVVANVNTLMGQFLFVFLSGAVFARMSQPSHPVRCSKKAIIRIDDFTLPSVDVKEKFRVFAVRLVLTGPPPCELVDAKICLTFRIFIKLPSGSMFCTTQDLELVRPEVPYLRYGIMVRHIIDKRSPLYAHTMETLSDGDASFSLTISGQERTSMQPIFHLEDYFVCDGDVAWDGDYVDFIHVNAEGQRVLDHSKIDEIQISKETKFGSDGTQSSVQSLEKDGSTSPGPVKGWSANALRGRKIWSSKSTSFTRADW